MPGDSTIIKFQDHAENQEGFILIRRFDDKVAVCLSLETNGDVEVLIDKMIVQKLINVLQESVN